MYLFVLMDLKSAGSKIPDPPFAVNLQKAGGGKCHFGILQRLFFSIVA